MFNLVVLTGRLTATPELKVTTNGINVCSFTMAVDRPFKTGDEKQTDFINCVAWRQNADFVSKYFLKGKQIGIEGNLQQRRYTDKDGNNRVAYEVLVNRAHFMGDNENKANDNLQEFSETLEQAKKSSGVDIDMAVEDDEDLPF